jgi:hypothetical protein
MPAWDDGVDLTLEVGESGEIVEISRAARRRLATAAGRWRLVPSPQGLLLLRRVGDEGGEGPRVALAGDIAGPGVLADVINFIHFNQWDGALAIVDEASRRTLTFHKGQLLGVSSNLPEDRLGAMLVRFGHLSEEQLGACVREVTPQRRLGTVIVDKGLMSSTDLFEGVRRQAEEIFYAVLLQRRGAFYVTREAEPPSAVRLHLDTQSLLLEGLRRIDEMAYFRAKLAGPDVVLSRRGAPPDSLAGDVLLVYRLVDGKRSLGEIARDSKLGEFAATRAAFELLQRGAVQERPSTTTMLAGRRQRATIPPDATAAMIEAYNAALARVHGLCVSRGKRTTVGDAVAAFMTGSDRFARLFVGVVPGEDGALPHARLLENVAAQPNDEGCGLLQAALQELVVFVLFLAEGAIERSEEQAIHDNLGRTLAQLGV